MLGSLIQNCVLSEYLAEALFVLSPSGEILHANQNALQLMRVEGDLTGRRFAQLLGGGQARRHASLIRRVRTHRQEITVELPHRYDADERWLRVRYVPLGNESGDELVILALSAI